MLSFNILDLQLQLKKDKILNCVCLQWATEHKTDHSIDLNPASLVKLEFEEWFGLVPLF